MPNEAANVRAQRRAPCAKTAGAIGCWRYSPGSTSANIRAITSRIRAGGTDPMRLAFLTCQSRLLIWSQRIAESSVLGCYPVVGSSYSYATSWLYNEHTFAQFDDLCIF